MNAYRGSISPRRREGVLSLQALLQRQQQSSLRDQTERVRVVNDGRHGVEQGVTAGAVAKARREGG
ncbi:MAG: hypothetical protein R3A48_00955 [Polyangiales bacterium]